MAVGLRFTDGTVTVTLSNGTTGIVTDYVQGNAEAHIETVTDVATVLLLGGFAAIRATIEDLNRLFWTATERRKTPGWYTHIYVERDPGTGTYYRSEVIEATPIQTPQSLDGGIAQGKIEIKIAFTRHNYWEGAETELALTNGNGSGITGGLNIRNHDDATAGHDNWVEFATVDSGDLPTPLKVILAHQEASLTTPKFIWMGALCAGGSTSLILEAENATGKTGTVDATCSNGKREDVSLTGGSEATLLEWSWSQSGVPTNLWKAIIRFADTANITTTRFRIKVAHNVTGTVVWQSDWVQPKEARQFQEFVTMRLPPYLLDSYANMQPLKLQITGYNTSTVTLKFDFLHPMPMDDWRVIRLHSSEQLAVGDKLIDDGIINSTYVEDSTGQNQRSYLTTFGNRIRLLPNATRRLFILIDYGSNTIDYITKVRIYYRARWLSL